MFGRIACCFWTDLHFADVDLYTVAEVWLVAVLDLMEICLKVVIE